MKARKQYELTLDPLMAAIQEFLGDLVMAEIRAEVDARIRRLRRAR